MRNRVTGEDVWDVSMVLGTFAIMALAGVGWVLNVVKFFMALGEPLTMMEIVRAFSIVPFFFIGCIIGYL